MLKIFKNWIHYFCFCFTENDHCKSINFLYRENERLRGEIKIWEVSGGRLAEHIFKQTEKIQKLEKQMESCCHTEGSHIH